MHTLIGEYDSRWCFSYLPKRAPRSKDLLTVLPKPISLPKPIILNPLCIFVTTSLLKIRISLWWMLNKTTFLSHILLTFNKLLCKFASKINVTDLLSFTQDSGCRGGSCRPSVLLSPRSLAITFLWTHTIRQMLLLWGTIFILVMYTFYCKWKNHKDSLVN